MKKVKRCVWLGLLVAAAMSSEIVRSAEIDLVDLMRETQKLSKKIDEMCMVWWLPEEYWKVSLGQVPGASATQVEAVLKTIRPYTIVAVVDGTVGPFGGVNFQSEDSVRARTRLIDSQDTIYVPKSQDQLDADVRNMLQMLKPVLANMLGPLGQNVHFLLFPAETAEGRRIAVATEKGGFKVRLGDREFSWRLPLDAVLPAKLCPGCGQECKGSWNYCPWCGKNLMEK